MSPTPTGSCTRTDAPAARRQNRSTRGRAPSSTSRPRTAKAGPSRSRTAISSATGIDGARHARGTVVVIDVLRSFTVSAYALAGGARECRLVKTVEEARALEARTPGAVLCAEEEALPVPGIAISNSPTAILQAELQGRI